MTKRKILVQLDPDPHASLFDAVVAIDAGTEQLLQYASVQVSQVRDLVHGAIFTRGGADLASTAIFIGGSNVEAGEQLLAAVKKSFYGPSLRVSVMLDANGANTTAAAAVIAAGRHVTLKGSTVAVLGGTGPVGLRVARLAARQGATVRIASRQLNRAQSAAASICQQVPEALIAGFGIEDESQRAAFLQDADVLFAAGAAGAEMLSQEERYRLTSLRVAIDLNAVPPVGLPGIDPGDKAKERNEMICYGAIGVGGTKMKIHRAAVARLFQANDLILDAEEIYAIGQYLEQGNG